MHKSFQSIKLHKTLQSPSSFQQINKITSGFYNDIVIKRIFVNNWNEI